MVKTQNPLEEKTDRGKLVISDTDIFNVTYEGDNIGALLNHYLIRGKKICVIS